MLLSFTRNLISSSTQIWSLSVPVITKLLLWISVLAQIFYLVTSLYTLPSVAYACLYYHDKKSPKSVVIPWWTARRNTNRKNSIEKSVMSVNMGSVWTSFACSGGLSATWLSGGTYRLMSKHVSKPSEKVQPLLCCVSHLSSVTSRRMHKCLWNINLDTGNNPGNF